MHKNLLIVLMPLFSLMVIPFVVQAATITTCTFDKDTYHQGETGYITVAVYNNEEEKIRVTELTATIDYYYADGNIYLQKFYADASLPAEIQPVQSRTFQVPFSLPTNIASGYTKVDVKTMTEKWDFEPGRWFPSDHPTSQLELYIESPYKQQSEGRLMTAFLLGVTAIVLAVVTAFLFILNRKARLITQTIA